MKRGVAAFSSSQTAGLFSLAAAQVHRLLNRAYGRKPASVLQRQRLGKEEHTAFGELRAAFGHSTHHVVIDCDPFARSVRLAELAQDVASHLRLHGRGDSQQCDAQDADQESEGYISQVFGHGFTPFAARVE
jgi:hypothetical protein